MPPELTQLIIHHDDLGGSHSANAAFVELWDQGVVTCGSVMAPCPWFPEIAQICRQRPDLDVGVHLTLTSEFSNYRWRPLTAGRTLVDRDGYMWATNECARAAAKDEVKAELQRQIEVALEAGIDVTHLDSHMGTVWQSEFLDIYLNLGREYRLPIVLTDDVQELSAPHADLSLAFDQLDQASNPRFKRFLTTPFNHGDGVAPLSAYADILRQAVPGLNWCGFHFAKPADIEHITTDAPIRIREYEMARSGELVELIQSLGYALVGMRALRDRMRASRNKEKETSRDRDPGM